MSTFVLSGLAFHLELREKKGETVCLFSICSEVAVPSPCPRLALMRGNVVLSEFAAWIRAVILRDCIGSSGRSLALLRNWTARYFTPSFHALLCELLRYPTTGMNSLDSGLAAYARMAKMAGLCRRATYSKTNGEVKKTHSADASGDYF
jgi:hypothetical protein